MYRTKIKIDGHKTNIKIKERVVIVKIGELFPIKKDINSENKAAK